ncbi:hypothetical protein AWB81_05861 [Caballeronia arationis]|uniref:hypothetical protein n=1 Tax=Caballeronia arationis TaxID=1777142 RepID=UPI00074B8D6F|nr:hypothetical protein [Caballeronia arationis]SAL00210.1 hypothetical protein AWB81_05861 [Caballeronia arationis]
MSTWNEIALTGNGTESEPCSLHWKKMKSTDEAFKDFLINPLTALSSDLSEVDSSWSVQSQLIGHEIGLSMDAVFIVGLIYRLRKTVFLTLYKYPVS